MMSKEAGKTMGFLSQNPLLHTKIIVTRARTSPSKLADKLRELGAEVYELPSIKIMPLVTGNDALNKAMATINEYTWLIFTSAVAVNLFFAHLMEKKLEGNKLCHLQIAAVGSETKKEIEKQGVPVAYTPQDYNGEALAKGLLAYIDQKDKLLLLRAKIGSEDMVRILNARGISVHDVSLYDTVRETEYAAKTLTLLEKGQVDFVTFTSSSTVEGFVSVAPDFDFSKIKCVCIGEKTAETAGRYGFKIYISNQATIDSMVDKMKEIWAHE